MKRSAMAKLAGTLALSLSLIACPQAAPQPATPAPTPTSSSSTSKTEQQKLESLVSKCGYSVHSLPEEFGGLTYFAVDSMLGAGGNGFYGIVPKSDISTTVVLGKRALQPDEVGLWDMLVNNLGGLPSENLVMTTAAYNGIKNNVVHRGTVYPHIPLAIIDTTDLGSNCLNGETAQDVAQTKVNMLQECGYTAELFTFGRGHKLGNYNFLHLKNTHVLEKDRTGFAELLLSRSNPSLTYWLKPVTATRQDAEEGLSAFINRNFDKKAGSSSKYGVSDEAFSATVALNKITENRGFGDFGVEQGKTYLLPAGAYRTDMVNHNCVMANN